MKYVIQLVIAGVIFFAGTANAATYTFSSGLYNYYNTGSTQTGFTEYVGADAQSHTGNFGNFLTASFTFDNFVTNDFTGLLEDDSHITSWKITSGTMSITNATATYLSNKFLFENGEIVKWDVRTDQEVSDSTSTTYYSATVINYEGHDQSIFSKSTEFGPLNITVDSASYFSLGPTLPSAPASDSWTNTSVISAVPEPSIYLTLIIGLILLTLTFRLKNSKF